MNAKYYATHTLKLIGLLTLFAIVSGCASHTTVREHPELEDQLLTIDRVLVVPPEVEITQINFSTDDSRLPEKEKEVQLGLSEHAQTHLLSKGYEYHEFDLDSAIMDDDELAYALTQVRDGLVLAKETLYKQALTEDEKRSIKATVGTGVNVLVEKTGADSFLILTYGGFKKSDGSFAKDVAVSVLIGLLTGGVPVSPKEGAYLEAALIDGVTGEVLWIDAAQSQSLEAGLADGLLVNMPQDIDPDQTLPLNSEPTVESETEVDSDPEVPATPEGELPSQADAGESGLLDKSDS